MPDFWGEEEVDFAEGDRKIAEHMASITTPPWSPQETFGKATVQPMNFGADADVNLARAATGETEGRRKTFIDADLNAVVESRERGPARRHLEGFLDGTPRQIGKDRKGVGARCEPERAQRDQRDVLNLLNPRHSILRQLAKLTDS